MFPWLRSSPSALPFASPLASPFASPFAIRVARPPARTPDEVYFRVAGLLEGPPDAQGRKTARDRFRFRAGDIKLWQRLGDANVILMHSWETSIRSSRKEES